MKKILCNELDAVYCGDPIFPEPLKFDFQIIHPHSANISIIHYPKRKIVIQSDSALSTHDMYSILENIEKLIMLVDGRFYELEELVFKNSDPIEDETLPQESDRILNERLAYYSSVDFCRCSINRLLNYDCVLTAEIFQKWVKLVEDLDIVHQVFLYSISDNNLPIDMRCAFLIEQAEPLVDIIKTRTHYFSSINPDDRNTTLINCLDAIITRYGEEIFDKELNGDFSKTLKELKTCRIRIMHIKVKQNQNTLNGIMLLLYSVKMYLLYRIIMLELIGIEKTNYLDNLLKCVNKWENHISSV